MVSSLRRRLRRIAAVWPPALWLSAIGTVSLLGALALVLAPSAAGAIWSTGVVINLAATLVLGAVLGWRARWRDLALGIPYGSIVVLSGIDLGCLATPGSSAFSLALIDILGAVLAPLGLAALLIAGALGGTCARAANRRCTGSCRRPCAFVHDRGPLIDSDLSLRGVAGRDLVVRAQ